MRIKVSTVNSLVRDINQHLWKMWYFIFCCDVLKTWHPTTAVVECTICTERHFVGQVAKCNESLALKYTQHDWLTTSTKHYYFVKRGMTAGTCHWRCLSQLMRRNFNSISMLHVRHKPFTAGFLLVEINQWHSS